MKRLRVLIAFGIGIAVLALGGTAFADQTTPGTPGTSNCEGQTTAYVAQGNPIPGISAVGIGNVAKANGISVQELKAAIAAFCAVP
jgi:hypothetical protein